MTTTTYKAKSSAVRAAKKLHGDNWADACKIVPVAEGFAVETLVIHDDSDANRLAMVDQLKSGLAAMHTPAKTTAKATVTAIKPVVPVEGKDKAAAVFNISTTTGENRSAGRPISADQLKVRRRLVEFIRKQSDGKFTVKQATKALKLKRMHVSNAMRWAESAGVVKRLGYDDVKRPGRKDVLFTALSLPPVAQAA